MNRQKQFGEPGLNPFGAHKASRKILKGFTLISISSGIISLIIASMVMAGWVSGNLMLTSIRPGFVSMKPNTAVSFILLGISLIILNLQTWAWTKALVRVLATFVLIISCLTMAEYILNVNLGIDELLFKDFTANTATFFPGRIALNTCMGLLFIALTLLFINTKSRFLEFITQFLPIATALTAIIPILGYLYGAEQLMSFSFFNNMALHTAIVLLVLSIGVSCQGPKSWLLNILLLEGYGGYMTRRLLPLIFLIPILILWINLVTNPEVLTVSISDLLILSLIYIAIVTFFIWRIASKVNVLDKERLKSQEATKTSEKRFRSTLDNMMEGCQLIGFDWRYLYINPAAEIHNRRPASELTGKVYMDMWPGVEKTGVFQKLQDCMIKRVPAVMENKFVFPDGKTGWFDLRIYPVPEGIFILSSDVSARVHTELYNQLEHNIMRSLNTHSDTHLMLSEIIREIKHMTNIEAVGIRIKEGNDYPYYTTEGFSEEFVRLERFLCSYDKDGNIIRDADNNPQLDCMCGNILSKRVDTSRSFFTEGGSFRSNNTTRLLAETTPEERLARTRNRCNSFGYESVALIPLLSGENVIGLLQLNDHRPDMFNEQIIPFFEKIGSSIAIAVVRNNAESEIKKLNEELENRIVVRTEQLMDSNRELEAFAYSVSHDLRTPLRHIIGFSQKLESGLNRKSEGEITRLTGIIKDSAFRMSKMIDELLKYSRVGRTELRKDNIVLNPVIEEVINESNDLTPGRSIIWKIDQLPDIKGDRTMIKLVFQNLLNNSI
ncbi:MAG: PAS domain-containing protein [Bacteroidales bacterium]|jgi:PAS domain-containing protein|nr:PAS domain-containing protein [Bacteroidales bacterium]